LKKINLKSILSFIGALLVVGFLSLQFDYLGSKFDDIFDNRGEVKFERYHRWNGILRAFNAEENWLIGTGSGDTQSIYDAAFIQGKFYEALKDKYNAHNQFLEFLIANGIFGLLLYIFVLLFFAYKTKLKGTALSFFIIITLFSLSESIFGRSQGVFIFAFFYAFLIVYYNTTPKRYVEK
jgi:O-antigen ligase